MGPEAGALPKEKAAPEPGRRKARPAPPEKPGDQIGRYKLLERIGEGGCGVVYLAEQEEPVRRRVALKVIKLGMDTQEVIARFEAERQALALMNHPNIAKVHDAGATETGRPYFVMELVEGIKITDYSIQNGLGTPQRLDLFIQVCQAIQHAHQKGVIHRDLKPSNILVTQQDGVPVPKVIDFGIAKATNQQPLTDKTVFTALNQFVGTPAYMSPEQAGLGGLDIDTRSDIYSLGVLLYELLTGQMPFAPDTLLKAGFDEMRRIIREEEPPKPSTRLTELARGQKSEVSGQWPVGSGQRWKEVRGDLDWIVMKCLEKNRARRYETASALAQDLTHHLKHEPVAAVAPTVLYRMGKFVRRHRNGVAAAAVMALLLVVGAVGSTWQAVRATRAEKRAEQVSRFLKEMLDGVRPSVAMGRDTRLMREMLDKAARRLAVELKGQPAVEAQLRRTIGRAYADLGEFAKAEEHFRTNLAIVKELFVEDHPEIVLSLNDIGNLLLSQFRSQEAETILRKALAMGKRLPGDHRRVVASSLHDLGVACLQQGKCKAKEAETLLREALALQEELLGKDHVQLSLPLGALAQALFNQGKEAEGEEMLRQAVERQKKSLGQEHPELGRMLYNLGNLLLQQRKWAEAERLFLRALDIQKKFLTPPHPQVAQTLNNLGKLYHDQERMKDADEKFTEALGIVEKLYPGENEEMASALCNLGTARLKLGRWDEGVGMLRQALEVRRRVHGNRDPRVAQSLNNLAQAYRVSHPAEAEKLYQEALDIQMPLGARSQEVAKLRNNIGWVMTRQRRGEEAEVQLRQALEIQREDPTGAYPEIINTLNNLGVLYHDQERLQEADERFAEAYGIVEKRNPGENEEMASALYNLGTARLKLGRWDEGEKMLRQALEVRRKVLGRWDSRVAETLNRLAKVFDVSNPAEAEKLYRDALEIQEKALGPRSQEAASLRHNLGLAMLRQQRIKEAEDQLRATLDIQRGFPSDQCPEIANTLNLLGAVYDRTDRPGQAEPFLQEAVELEEKRLGAQHPSLGSLHYNLGLAIAKQGRMAEAEIRFRMALAIQGKLPSDRCANMWNDLGEVLLALEQPVEAERVVRDAMAICQWQYGSRDPRLGPMLENLVQALHKQGRNAEEEAVARQARELQEKR
jgi:eukaryotic-like serine/threonine-protein kinase